MEQAKHDSSVDTLNHIERVRALLSHSIKNLQTRAEIHDMSKLQSPEKEAFDSLGDNLRGLTYGSPEYKAQLKTIKPAIQHHYACNDHHPEHYEVEGIMGMSMFSLIEMLCDWKAAGERHADGDFAKSLEINLERFKIPHPVYKILLNTSKELGFIDDQTMLRLYSKTLI